MPTYAPLLSLALAYNTRTIFLSIQFLSTACLSENVKLIIPEIVPELCSILHQHGYQPLLYGILGLFWPEIRTTRQDLISYNYQSKKSYTWNKNNHYRITYVSNYVTWILTYRSPGWFPSGSTPPLLGILIVSSLSTPAYVDQNIIPHNICYKRIKILNIQNHFSSKSIFIHFTIIHHQPLPRPLERSVKKLRKNNGPASFNFKELVLLRDLPRDQTLIVYTSRVYGQSETS